MSGWTKEPPSVGGWFWYKRPCDCCGQPKHVLAVDVEDFEERGLWFTDPWDRRRFNVHDAPGVWWPVPIQPPEEA